MISQPHRPGLTGWGGEEEPRGSHAAASDDETAAGWAETSISVEEREMIWSALDWDPERAVKEAEAAAVAAEAAEDKEQELLAAAQRQRVVLLVQFSLTRGTVALALLPDQAAGQYDNRSARPESQPFLELEIDSLTVVANMLGDNVSASLLVSLKDFSVQTFDSPELLSGMTGGGNCNPVAPAFARLVSRRGSDQHHLQGRAASSEANTSTSTDTDGGEALRQVGASLGNSTIKNGNVELGDGVDEARETPLLQVLVQAYDPTINGYDFVVQVRFEELVVVASPALLMGNLSHPHAAWLRALQSFFAGDDVRYYLSELEALWLTKMHGLRETMKQNRAYLKSLLASNGKLTVLDIDVEAPVLVVPEDPSSVLTPYLMLDLGRVRVATEALRDAARAAMLHNGEGGGAYGLGSGKSGECDVNAANLGDDLGTVEGFVRVERDSDAMEESAGHATALETPLSPLLRSRHFSDHTDDGEVQCNSIDVESDERGHSRECSDDSNHEKNQHSDESARTRAWEESCYDVFTVQLVNTSVRFVEIQTTRGSRQPAAEAQHWGSKSLDEESNIEGTLSEPKSIMLLEPMDIQLHLHSLAVAAVPMVRPSSDYQEDQGTAHRMIVHHPLPHIKLRADLEPLTLRLSRRKCARLARLLRCFQDASPMNESLPQTPSPSKRPSNEFAPLRDSRAGAADISADEATFYDARGSISGVVTKDGTSRSLRGSKGRLSIVGLTELRRSSSAVGFFNSTMQEPQQWPQQEVDLVEPGLLASSVRQLNLERRERLSRQSPPFVSPTAGVEEREEETQQAQSAKGSSKTDRCDSDSDSDSFYSLDGSINPNDTAALVTEYAENIKVLEVRNLLKIQLLDHCAANDVDWFSYPDPPSLPPAPPFFSLFSCTSCSPKGINCSRCFTNLMKYSHQPSLLQHLIFMYRNGFRKYLKLPVMMAVVTFQKIRLLMQCHATISYGISSCKLAQMLLHRLHLFQTIPLLIVGQKNLGVSESALCLTTLEVSRTTVFRGTTSVMLSWM